MRPSPEKLSADELLVELAVVARTGTILSVDDAVITVSPDSVITSSPDDVHVEGSDTQAILILIGHGHRLFGTPTRDEIVELIGRIPGRLQSDARRLSSEIWGVVVDA